MDNRRPRGSPGAVSYTHLDVYKRQVHPTAQGQGSWQFGTVALISLWLGETYRNLSLIHICTVVTNSVPVAAQLALANGGPTQVHLLGGRVRGITQATVGSETVGALARLRCDVAFLGTNGVSVRHGFSTPDPDEAAVKEAMVASARRVIVLADSSKIGVELLVTFAPTNAVDVLITDDGISAHDRAELISTGMEVVIA